MDVNKALTVLSRNPGAGLDLAALALELARDEYPDLDVTGYLSELDAMAHELRPKLRGPLPTRVESLCRYLFHDLGFRGNELSHPVGLETHDPACRLERLALLGHQRPRVTPALRA